MSMMIPPIIVLIGGFFTKNHVPYFQLPLVMFPLEPMVPTMVSTIDTHYPYGFFIKEIIGVPNLLC